MRGSKKLLALVTISIFGFLSAGIWGGYTIYSQNRTTERALRVSQLHADSASKAQVAILNMGKAETQLISASDARERRIAAVSAIQASSTLDESIQRLQQELAGNPKVAELSQLLHQIEPAKMRVIRAVSVNDAAVARLELQHTQEAMARVEQISGELVQEESSQLLSAVMNQGKQAAFTLRVLGILVVCCLVLGVIAARELQARAAVISQVNQKLREGAAELDETNSRLKAVLDAATQIAIIATDPQGLITIFNAGAERMLGYSAEEMVGRNTPEILHFKPEIEARSRELSQNVGYLVEGFEVLVEVACLNSYEEREWTYIRKDGTRLTVSLAVTALQDWQGKLTGFLGVANDVTEHKRVEEELRSALQMKSDFVSFATHQLRTPLAGIKWLLELAAQSEMPQEPSSLVQDAREAAERLIRMVNDLLDASRLEGSKLTLNPKDTNLGELTRSVLGDVNHQIQSQEHTVSVKGADEIPVVWVDPQLFRQVILNLISNAVKYTPPKGQITIEMNQHNGSLHWSIHDNGIGIPKAAQKRLFEKFFRADNVYKVETEGTGLGLYIVRLVVERSGGKIWCESEEGQGTTFRLELPAKVEHA